MSDARIIHKKASGGERVCRLNHLQHRVWIQYVLSADDYGVMRYSVSGLRHDNPKLEEEPLKRVQSALDFVLKTGLVQMFNHQGACYLWQTDWQDFQGIRYPRATVNPAPSETELEKATKATRKLFTLHPQYSREESREDSRQDFSENVAKIPIPAGAGAARNPNPTSNPSYVVGIREESARETKPAPLIDGKAQRFHAQHAWCDRVRGVCVPFGLHGELQQRLGTDNADAELRAWYPTVIAKYTGRPIGDDVFDFWKNAFGEWQGTVSQRPIRQTAPTDRAGKALTAGERVIARQLQQKALTS